MTDNGEPTEALLAKVDQLRAQRASLKADLERMDQIPTGSQVKEVAQQGRIKLSARIEELGQSTAAVEEKVVLYRTAGWTVFEMDLDIGRRDRQARRLTSSGNGKSGLGLGVRLETYHKGRFYEPFYLIFAKPEQLMLEGAKVQGEGEGSAAVQAQSSHKAVRLVRHTIPHFVPLGEILQDYMRPSEGEQEAAGAGGLELLDSLMQQEGLTLFLSHLHAHLQSFVSRRQQAVSLSELRLPGSAPSALRAFGNDCFGQLSIQWDMPTPTAEELETFGRGDGVIDEEEEGDAMELQQERKEGEVNTSIEISIVYHDLSNDSVGRPAKEMSKRRQMIQSLGSEAETPGLKCTNATVLVESVRTRVPAARRGISDKHERLQLRRIRRTDWEALFTRSSDKLPSLPEALREVLGAAWKEELQRVLIGRE